MKNVLNIFLLNFLFISCGTSDNSKNQNKINNEPHENNALPSELKSNVKQLNINILWDLSDRIDNSINPSSPPQFERDIEIIKTLTEVFKLDMQKKGAYKAKSKIKVFFTPPPMDAAINSIAKNLSCDLSSFSGDGSNRKKKQAYDSLTKKFYENAIQIYNLTIQNNKEKKHWEGSDIWRFFKNDVKDYCIDPDSNYRNILVILTDGYIYHKDSKNKQANRTMYILPEALKVLRNKLDWKTIFNKGDYGLITTRNDLQNLEILVLEINPSKEFKIDEDIIKAYLSKWFEEMGVPKENYSCFNTDLPENTKKRIEKFINK